MSSVELVKLDCCTDEYWDFLLRGNAYERESSSCFGRFDAACTRILVADKIRDILDKQMASGDLDVFVVKDKTTGELLATLSFVHGKGTFPQTPLLKILPEHIRYGYDAYQLQQCKAMQMDVFATTPSGIPTTQVPDVLRALGDAAKHEVETHRPQLVYGVTGNPGLPAVIQKMFLGRTSQQHGECVSYRVPFTGLKKPGHAFILSLDPVVNLKPLKAEQRGA